MTVSHLGLPGFIWLTDRPGLLITATDSIQHSEYSLKVFYLHPPYNTLYILINIMLRLVPSPHTPLFVALII